ncbi:MULTISPECIES: hypothetical protein [unclassified Streptomyces]|uniref:hypothetical protein n=1 Tax=unclassified Streptomyces TaxID=2593676 RepID=UPI003243F0A5
MDDDVTQVKGQLRDESGDAVPPVSRGDCRRNDDQLQYVRRMCCRSLDDGATQCEVVRCWVEVAQRLLADRVDDAATQVCQLTQSGPDDVACDETYDFSFASGDDEAEQA